MAQLRAGGSFADFQSLDGVLSFFLIENGANLSAGFDSSSGAANSLEEVRQVIESRGSIVIFNQHSNPAHLSVCIANSDWNATNLQANIVALGATAGADNANCQGAAVTEPGFVLAT